MSVDELVINIRRQAEITAKDVVESLKGSIECGYMTYPELIGVLRHFLKQAIDEMRCYRPGMAVLSLKETGLENLYNALEDLERKEQREK